MMPIGVLAMQGGFEAHAVRLSAMGHAVREVRSTDDLARVRGLVLPGGESSVQWKLMEAAKLIGPIRAFAEAGHPILATCAGLILASHAAYRSCESLELRSEPLRGEPWGLDLIDVDVLRNAYGRQLDSFEGRDDDDEYELVFIRAPRIVRVGPDVKVLARSKGEPVLVRQGAIVAAAFHPELSEDRSIHRLAFGASTIATRSPSSRYVH